MEILLSGADELTDEERATIDLAMNELIMVSYHSDHVLIHNKMEQLDQVTRGLAGKMMNTAVGTALKGTKIE